MKAYLGRLIVYPIKSLDGWDRQSSRVLASGALEWDRRFAFLDEAGKFVNGKRDPAIQKIRSRYEAFSEQSLQVWVQFEGEEQEHCFTLPEMSEELDKWVSSRLERNVNLKENKETGFPDDLESNGPTIISLATLQEVANWFELDVEEATRRFRSNLILEGCPPFYEDNLFGSKEKPKPFRIGNLTFEGVNPCQRCAVPSRNSLTGEPTPGFQKDFARRREQQLPQGVIREHFNHFYRLAVNTRLPAGQEPSEIRVADRIELV